MQRKIILASTSPRRIDTKNEKLVSFHEKTKVFIKKLTPAIIKNYIATGEPLDKAGAYGLQQLGAVLIEKIDGDFFNAAGLPLSKLAEKLKLFSVQIL